MLRGSTIKNSAPSWSEFFALPVASWRELGRLNMLSA